MALRELLLRLQVQVDPRGVKKANSALAGIRKAAIAVGTVFVAGRFARGIGAVLELGSAANETSNVIQTAFEDSANAVEDWAKRQAEVMGRSRFELREMAAATGAIVQPMLGSAEAAADMSTQVAQLAVDLGSFFNANDKDALRALQSGLVGSTEPLLRFGVVMKQANLQTFAQSQGISKLVKDMNEAELTALRFNFIMDKTRKAQGDAAKTSGGFANQTKALKAAWKDALTTLGQRLVPTFEKLLKVLIPLTKQVGEALVAAFDFLANIVDGIISMFRLLNETYGEFGNVLGGLVIALGSLGVAMLLFGKKAVFSGLRVAAAWALANLPLILMLSIIALLLLAIEDFIVFMQGGESVIGDLIDSFRRWVDEMGGVSGAIAAIFGKLFQKIFNLSDGTTRKIIDAFSSVFESIRDLFVSVGTFLGESVAAIVVGFQRFGKFMTDLWQGIKDFVLDVIDSITSAIDRALDKVSELLSKATDALGITDVAGDNERVSRQAERLDRRREATRRENARRAGRRTAALRKLEQEGFGTFTPAKGPRGIASITAAPGADQAALERRFQQLVSSKQEIVVNVDARGNQSPAAVGDQVASKIANKPQIRQAQSNFATARGG